MILFDSNKTSTNLINEDNTNDLLMNNDKNVEYEQPDLYLEHIYHKENSNNDTNV